MCSIKKKWRNREKKGLMISPFLLENRYKSKNFRKSIGKLYREDLMEIEQII